MWEDPREIHRVIATPSVPASSPSLRLQYWGSWWPERHLPKDREPGGGDIGWLELGNWWKYGWRDADTDTESFPDGSFVTFRFHPVNRREFAKVAQYPATFRYTLKLRVVDASGTPVAARLQAYTDSAVRWGTVRVVWREPSHRVTFLAFNGAVREVRHPAIRSHEVDLEVTTNPDPNTFDRTLVSVSRGNDTFTFRWDDLASGPLFLPHIGAAVLPHDDSRDYAAIAKASALAGSKTLRQRVAERPEQTWDRAWAGMPLKKSDIYFPLGLDGGRQRFRIWPDGRIDFRHNDDYLKRRPGQDTPRLATETGPVTVRFDLPERPSHRTLADQALPILTTVWSKDGLAIEQIAFVTPLAGISRTRDPIPGDTPAVLMLRLSVSNTTAQVVPVPWKLHWEDPNGARPIDARAESGLAIGGVERAQLVNLSTAPAGDDPTRLTIPPGSTDTFVLKIPYLVPASASDREQLAALDFDRERVSVTAWWDRRLANSARLHTPSPMLNEFHRSVAMHLLVNCEREPDADRRFARVGSFAYGAYGNESCMMVLDLERRGFHREAQECLDAWLHYQGTVPLPGSFDSAQGVLYGAGGYEAGGYNQHHGWILWMLAEHFRFTRDTDWLRHATPGILKAADWILSETARTQDRHPLERGLLPAGSLEDIGDWWTWLSTSCYTWRGLDHAAWALEQIQHPDAARIRRGATAYHAALMDRFREARDRSPVVRLRNGTAVPKIPSHVHRRGRTFGWICETLEGPLHLLITRAIDPRSREADWILDDYEDNLYLSNQFGYTLPDFENQWFDLGGMSMQACLLLQVEPWLYRDDVKHALRGLFNAQAASYFPDVRMNTEHALPELGDWRGDHFKSSDEANACGWLRQLFVREENDQELWIGQAIPRDWLRPGNSTGIERTSTWFGPVSVRYTATADSILASLDGPTRNPPKSVRLRFRDPAERPLRSVTVNGKAWKRFAGEWVELPSHLGTASVEARFR